MSLIKMNSGIMYDFLNPTIDMININDIAHSLVKEQRFSNQLDYNWSVIQHALFVTHLVKNKGGNSDELYQALHHDDFEAYGKDVPTPLKKLLPNYKVFEKNGLKTIGLKFNLQLDPMFKLVKECDRLAVYIEDVLFFNVKSDWHDFTRNDFHKLNESNVLSNYIDKLQMMCTNDLKSLYIKTHDQLKNKISKDSVHAA